MTKSSLSTLPGYVRIPSVYSPIVELYVSKNHSSSWTRCLDSKQHKHRNGTGISRALYRRAEKFRRLLSKEQSRLYLSIQKEDEEAISKLLKDRLDPNIPFFTQKESERLVLPVTLAVKLHRSSNILQLLIDNGATVNVLVPRELIMHCPSLNLAPYTGPESLLSYAIRQQKLEITRTLLANGAAVETKNGIEPLYIATATGNVLLVKALLNYHPDINDPQSGPCGSCLHACVELENIDVLLVLLESGNADPNIQDLSNLRTPLHLAAKNKSRSFARLLLEHDADPCKEDLSGITPLQIAEETGDVRMTDLLTSYLHRRGTSDEINADTNTGKESKEDLFRRAASCGYTRTLRQLLREGVSINCLDKAGWSALHHAVHSGKESAVKELISAGVNINIGSSKRVVKRHPALEASVCFYDKGDTALHICGRKSPQENRFREGSIAEQLIKAGADLCRPNGRGELPLMMEKKRNSFEEPNVGALKKRLSKTRHHRPTYNEPDKVESDVLESTSDFSSCRPREKDTDHWVCLYNDIMVYREIVSLQKGSKSLKDVVINAGDAFRKEPSRRRRSSPSSDTL